MSGLTWRDRIRSVSFPVKLLFAVNLVLLLAFAASALGLHAVSSSFETVTAARRFVGESRIRFAQLACFLPVGEEKTEEDIWQIRQSLESKFVEQSLEAPEGGSLYLDAYSGSASVSVVTDHGSAQVSAIGVGGNFFYFHPLRLRSGAYIAERDLMDDLVVLDETLAWRLFGGMELTGMTLYINGEPFVVAGVVAMEEDFATDRALSREGSLFLSYSALHRLNGELKVDCYEAVLPDPISGYARGMLEQLLPAGEETIVENSGRFSPERLWRIIGSFGERSMRSRAVVYPYWENALRFAEDRAALLLVLAVLAALFPAVTFAVLAVRGFRALWRRARSAAAACFDNAVERHKEKRLSRLAAKDTEGE